MDTRGLKGTTVGGSKTGKGHSRTFSYKNDMKHI